MRQLNGTYFGECTSASSAENKVVDIVGFDLVKGVSILVRFTNTNTASVGNITLNVTNTGAIPIKRYGTNLLPSASDIMAGMILQFVYDGFNWIWVGHVNTVSSDTYVSQNLFDGNEDRPLLMSYSNSSNSTNSITNIAYRNNSILANPSTGTITATNFVGNVNGHTIAADVPEGADFSDTTYTAGGGISISNSNVISNTGVRTIVAGTDPGTINVNMNGVISTITIPGLGENAYSSDTYAPINSPALTGTPTAPTAAAGTNTTQIATTAFVNNAVSSLSGPMRFKGTLGTTGTITTLPTAADANKGYAYKVIEDGTYSSIAAKNGDLFVSDGTNWILIPSGDEPNGTVTSITAGSGLSGGTITSSGTISHAAPSGASADTFGGGANNSVIESITTDAFGHVTAVTTVTAIPSASVADRVAHTLTFGANGEFSYDGSADITVPVYTGSMA